MTNFWRNFKNKIVGGAYSACYLNNGPIEDINNIMISLTNNCGIITNEYKINNQLLHDAFLGTSNRFNILFYDKDVSPISIIVYKIVYMKLQWSDANYKSEIINIIFDSVDDETKEQLNLYLAPLTNPEIELPKEAPSELISALYGLVKFLMVKEPMKDISIIIEEVINSQFVNKTVTNILIGFVMGYTEIYKHQPFFKDRNHVDEYLKNYIKYLHGEFSRIPLGKIKIAGNNVTRFMHLPNSPAPNGWWSLNYLDESINGLATLNIVSYIEDENGSRYRSAVDFSAELLGSKLIKNDIDAIMAIDKNIVDHGIGLYKK